MEGIIGEIRMFGGSQTPRNWLPCNGELVTVAAYPKLFGVIGGSFGVTDNRSAFYLPNMKGRAPIGVGLSDANGPPVSKEDRIDIGMSVGSEFLHLSTQHMPEVSGESPVETHIAATAAGMLRFSSNAPNTVPISVPCNTDTRELRDSPRNGYVAITSMVDDQTRPAVLFSSTANSTMAAFNTSVDLNYIELPFISESAVTPLSVGQPLDPSTLESAVSLVQPGLYFNFYICYAGELLDFNPPPSLPDPDTHRKEVTELTTKLFAGKQDIGRSERKQLKVKVTHDLRLVTKDMVIHATVSNINGYQDIFSVNVIGESVTGNSFEAVVTRIDGNDWGQEPVLSWIIVVPSL